MKQKSNRALCPRGGNDRVYTPAGLARQIVRHFPITGHACEPCYGQKAFLDALKAQPCVVSVTGYELDAGTDFLTDAQPLAVFDWVVTNPPWSKLRPFLAEAMRRSHNVVFLSLTNAFFMRARLKDIAAAGFAFREIAFVQVPEKPWPQTGFALSATWLQRGYGGQVQLTQLPNWAEPE